MEDVPLFPEAPAVTVERTLAIIKPDAIHFADEIIQEIKSNGFTILQVLGWRYMHYSCIFMLGTDASIPTHCSGHFTATSTEAESRAGNGLLF